jgi:hypothetical protein
MTSTKGERSDAILRTALQKDADRCRRESPKAGQQAPPEAALKAALKAPWPDQTARRDMSETELALEDGKHDKNADWKKTW